MLTVLLRATILFLSAVFVVRLMGKRQVGQLQPYELVIAIMIAELAATPMEDVGVPLLYGIVPMLTLLILHSAFSVACVKNQRLREFLNGMPSVLIRRGVIDRFVENEDCGLTVIDSEHWIHTPEAVAEMEKWEENLSILDDILRSKKRRHITGGILVSIALFFGGLAVTVITIKDNNESEDEVMDYE